MKTRTLLPLILISLIFGPFWGCKTVPKADEEPTRDEIMAHIEAEAEIWTYAVFVLFKPDREDVLRFMDEVLRVDDLIGTLDERPQALIGDLVQILLMKFNQEEAQRMYLLWMILDRYVLDYTSIEVDEDVIDVARAIIRGMLDACDNYLMRAVSRPVAVGAWDEVGGGLKTVYLNHTETMNQ